MQKSKSSNKKLLICLIILLLCISKGIVQAQVETSFITLDKEIIMNTLFDEVIFNSENEALWKPNFSEKMTFHVSADNYCHTKMDTIMYYKAQGKKVAVIIFTTFKYDENGEKEGCHVCAPIIGMAIFTELENRGWELNQFTKNFNSFGAYGERGTLSLEKLGKDHFFVKCESSYGNNGSSDGYVSYHSIETPFSEVLNYVSYETSDNETVRKTKLKLLPTKDAYYKIELTTTVNKKQISRLIYEFSTDYSRFIEIKNIEQTKKNTAKN